jgi:hypothetical protein
MKTVEKILFIGVFIMVSGWQGNNHLPTELNIESISKFAYREIDSNVHPLPNTAFKLYPYHNRLNRRHVT